ncbi:MAG: peptide chain release factor 1 [Ruminococcaceae bacterium]|nr:peptide chain release factor 1 [Oscillospiraceae bacterium]
MFIKLAQAEDRFREIEQLITLPHIVSNNKEYSKLMKEYKALTPVIEKYREYKSEEKEMRESDEMMRDSALDSELRELAEYEFKIHRERCDELTEELRILLIPRDPNDSRNVIIEIRQGAGGEEAALFGADLYRMYSMYAASRGFKIEIVNLNETELGGIKEVNFMVMGDGAYSRFKFESGVHRVQRIPVTESNGRIQTSTVTVAVLPEAEDVEVEVNPADIKIESCKSSGAGGQHINKTESAVRLTHKPSGIVIECDQERSQLQNKEKAMKILYTKLYDMKQREQDELIASTRKNQVGSGDRSEKIRTYNFPQSRITDHRINKTLFSLSAFLDGDIDGLITELIAQDTAERLKGDGGV